MRTFLTTFLRTSKGVTQDYYLPGIAVVFSCHNIPIKDVSLTTVSKRHKKSLSSPKQKIHLQFCPYSNTTNSSKKIYLLTPNINIHDKNQNSMSTKKTVNLCLSGIDGNAFAIIGAFKRQAFKEKWTTEEIDAVIKEAQKSDYDHLLSTILNYCEAQED